MDVADRKGWNELETDSLRAHVHFNWIMFGLSDYSCDDVRAETGRHARSLDKSFIAVVASQHMHMLILST